LFVFDYFFSFFDGYCSWHNVIINKHIVKLYSCCYIAFGRYGAVAEHFSISPFQGVMPRSERRYSEFEIIFVFHSVSRR
jgi:hypothetical protein